jgi:hypothetical protein
MMFRRISVVITCPWGPQRLLPCCLETLALLPLRISSYSSSCSQHAKHTRLLLPATLRVIPRWPRPCSATRHPSAARSAWTRTAGASQTASGCSGPMRTHVRRQAVRGGRAGRPAWGFSLRPRLSIRHTRCTPRWRASSGLARIFAAARAPLRGRFVSEPHFEGCGVDHTLTPSQRRRGRSLRNRRFAGTRGRTHHHAAALKEHLQRSPLYVRGRGGVRGLGTGLGGARQHELDLAQCARVCAQRVGQQSEAAD